MSNVLPPKELSSKVQSLAQQFGLSKVAFCLGLADATVARLAAGLSVSEGTAHLAQSRVAAAEVAAAEQIKKSA